MHSELLEKLINPPLHSGNITYRELSHQTQQEIARFYKDNTPKETISKFGISQDRLKHILTKFDVPLKESRKNPRQPLPLPEKIAEKLDAMVGKRYEYVCKERTIKGYELTGKEVKIETWMHAERPYTRFVILDLKTALKELEKDFRLCG